jgi:hypothetical protein
MVKSLYGKTIMLWVNDLDFVVNINGKLEYSEGIPISQHHLFFLRKNIEGYFLATLSSHMQRINANISSMIVWGRGGSVGKFICINPRHQIINLGAHNLVRCR